MDIPDLLTEMATQIARLPALNGRAYYPARERVDQSPTVFLRMANDIPTRYTKARAGRQIVYPMIEIMVMVEKVLGPSKPQDEAKIDQLIGPILDMFDVTQGTDNINDRLPGLEGSVDRVWYDATIKRGVINLGVQECYGAIITVDPVFHRIAETVTLEAIP